MNISEYGASPHVDPIMQDLVRYDLCNHALELEAYGMTVVPPEKARLSHGFANRLRDAIVRTYEKRGDVVVGDPATATSAPRLDNYFYMIEEDDVFVEAATNPVALTLVRWMLGQSAMLDIQAWIMKAAGGQSPNLHIDAAGVPPGAGSIAHMCNVSWLCTDYEGADDGPTVFVPGSHKLGRAPLAHEANVETSPFKTFPLLGKAGSVAIWNGVTWHGAVARTKPGLRVTLVQTYARSYMRTSVNYNGRLSPQMLQKYPELERLIGKPLYPFDDPQRVDPSRAEWSKAPEADPYA